MARKKPFVVKAATDIYKAVKKIKRVKPENPQRRKENYSVSKRPPRPNAHE